MDQANSNKSKLILASGSPRRRMLLRAAGISFDAAESGIDETRNDGENGREYAMRMAREKALTIAPGDPGALVLAADTVVECDGEILLKPEDAADARRILRKLSGNTHTVITAFALARANVILELEPVASRVTFRPLDAGEIDAYIATGEPFDKAGAYGIQGDGAGFIVHVEGARDNVMGLPVRQVLEALRRHQAACQP